MSMAIFIRQRNAGVLLNHPKAFRPNVKGGKYLQCGQDFFRNIGPADDDCYSLSLVASCLLQEGCNCNGGSAFNGPSFEGANPPHGIENLCLRCKDGTVD